MATFLFDKHVFGPVKSRRLGNSLGINLLSTHYKVCDFDCIYCECGWTHHKPDSEKFVNKKVFLQLLESKLRQFKKDNIPVDFITYAGNGEPTLHPHFLEIAKKVSELRDQYFPDCKIALLSNGSTLGKSKIKAAFEYIEDVILKLDAVQQELFQLINRPNEHRQIDDICQNMVSLDGNFIAQSMFLKGTVDGVEFDNSEQSVVDKWKQKIQLVQPRYVQIYSIARDTPLETIHAVSNERLHNIAEQIEELGIRAEVY